MTPKFKVVIPARYASTRLPGKPLADLLGKPMVVRVVERAAAAGAEEVWVATDHPAVAAAVEAGGGRALLTRADHPSGTDRLGEVVERLGWADDTVVVNLQGDEPLLDPALVAAVARALASDAQAAIATAAHPITSADEFLNPAAVKVVCGADGAALYFSRAPIPWPRDAWAQGAGISPDPQVRAAVALPPQLLALRHIGLYAYRAGFLRTYAQLTPSPLEGIEMLEQLRALWHGYRIRVELASQAPPPGVDTPEDLERVRAVLSAAQG